MTAVASRRRSLVGVVLGLLMAALAQSANAQSAPVAVNDSYTTPQDTPLTVPAPGVLGNDSGASSAMLVSGPAHATLVLSANGGFTYTPLNGFNGSDSFTYRASNGSQDSNTATVTIKVASLNDGGTGGSPSPGATPELDSLVLFGTGLSGLTSYLWRRQRSRQKTQR